MNQEYEQGDELCYFSDWLATQRVGVNVGRLLWKVKVTELVHLLVHTLEYTGMPLLDHFVSTVPDYF